MNVKRIPELLLCALLGLVATIGVFYAFSSRMGPDGGQPLVDKGGKLTVVGAKGDSITATKITLVDIDGRATLTFNAGPPPTIDLIDSNGRKKVIDLAKLASNRLLFEPKE